ncbi:hypothetical protein GQ53DRAFT_717876 [Thozetella sp. PMI_491]|nr:hypothetical protein GQ53DRAFT_717876 [Thozetella sp. PMI_491]
MDDAQAPPQASAVAGGDAAAVATAPQSKTRSDSFSQQSDTSQTAAEFIRDQMQLEADAREALPYSIENCTKPLGPLRQSVFSCLTCNPPPANPKDPYDAAGICYSCSVQCHGEHTLVEIFTKRNFTCDCGTKRFPESSPCNLRINQTTNTKGGVHSEEPDPNNKYNHNFRNRFCGCECDYDPYQQKGTMFQCLGLGTHEEGGCGEDWWHPGCLVGLGPKWFEKISPKEAAKPVAKKEEGDTTLPTIAEDGDAPVTATANGAGDAEEEDDDLPPPPGFPGDEEFEAFLCYKCLDAFPWLKRYAGAPGFLPPVYSTQNAEAEETSTVTASAEQAVTPAANDEVSSKKRKATGDEEDAQDSKRRKSDGDASPTAAASVNAADVVPQRADVPVCKLSTLPPAPVKQFSLFLKEDFRSQICHCTSCFPLLTPHPQLIEEEETYEPPVSEEGSENGGSTHGSGSLLERGESALRNVDRVRAIEGVMAYNHLKDKLKPFFQQFAESGEAISAEDIKAYFARLRGDEEAIKEAGESARTDLREEQSGY